MTRASPAETVSNEHQSNSRPIRRSRVSVYGVRIVKTVLILGLTYAAILLLGLVPVNNDFQPTPGAVKLFLRSNAVHADLIMPIKTNVIDWRREFPDSYFRNDTSEATHVAIGWGDKGFFINTPTWDDLEIATALNALLMPSDTCIHVVMKQEHTFPNDYRSVDISDDQYQQLVDYVKATLHYEQDQVVLIPGASYGGSDAFFEAYGNYHALNTCNSWVGGGLKVAGVKTPWLTPLPKTPFLYLPD